MIKDLTSNDITNVNNLINDKNYIVNEYELNKNAKVYMKDNLIVAFISYSIYLERAELNYIFVKEECRSQHIATLLIQNMINECIEKNVQKIDLEVNINNIKAINLYRKFEFNIISTRLNYYNGVDAYLMLKELR